MCVVRINSMYHVMFFTYAGTMQGLQHDPEHDARISIRLFNKYYANPALKAQDERRLIDIRPDPSWAKQNDYRWEGVCMAAYMPKKCFCGAPTYAN